MQQDAFNPYQAPDTAIEAVDMPPLPGQTLWRDGEELLCLRDTPFPPHCVKCGAAVRSEEMKSRTFYWHAPWLYALILVSILVYAIAALITRKRSSHLLGLCETHRRRRTGFILLALGGFLAGPLLGIALGDDLGWIVGTLVFLVMLIWGMFGARILVPRRMDERYARYKGLAPAFLARLPALPRSMRS